MARKKMTKEEKVWKFLIKEPLASAKEVADKVGCSVKYVYTLKKKVGTPQEVFKAERLKKDIEKWDNIGKHSVEQNNLIKTTVRKSRSNVLTQADKLVNGARADEYGDAKQNFEDIAKLWSVLLGTEVTAQQVALCMIAVKSARLMKSDSPDSWVDICGYGALGGELHNA